MFSDKERELYEILCAERIQTIREKSLLEINKIIWMPNLSETEKFQLDIKRRRQYLKEQLGIYVDSMIETCKKVNKNVDETEFNKLAETLKSIVETSLKEISNKYKNNPFSDLNETVINANLYILENELHSLIPDTLLRLSRFKLETKFLDENESTNEFERALAIIKTAMLSQSQTPVNLEKHDEDSYRKIISNALRIFYGGRVTLESLNKNGKTDIIVKVDNKNILIAECKIWKSEEGFKEAINQLLSRYLEWHDNKAVLIIFCRNESLTNVLKKINEIVGRHINYWQTLNNSEDSEFRFLFHHPEDNYRELTLHLMAFKIPKNQKLPKQNK